MSCALTSSVHQTPNAVKIFTNAMVLRELSTSLSTLTIPIQPVRSWDVDSLRQQFEFEVRKTSRDALSRV